MTTRDATSSSARKADLGDVPAAASLDTGELTCAALILAVKQALDRLATDEILAVISRDPSARLDLPAWCRMTGHEYLGAAGCDNDVIYYLRK